MEIDSLLAELERVLAGLSISLEFRNLDDEEFTITSGYCEVKSQGRLIIEKSYSPVVQLKTILTFLKGRNLDNVYISPHIRDIIESDIA